MNFKKRDLKSLTINPMALFLDDWPLLTAGNETDGYNTMTISWGHIGGIWNKPTLTVYVRPQRFTKAFMDQFEFFSVSVLPSTYKKILHHLGTVSGRDENKIQTSGLTPAFAADATYFEEAKLVFVCRKLYAQPMEKVAFTDQLLMEKMYPEKDFHTLYVGEIVEILTKNDNWEEVT